MTRRITIDPITRLEGHGKIEIFLDDRGDVERAYLQVPELRGFEQFAVGRPVEEMPRITPADLRRLPDGPSHGREPRPSTPSFMSSRPPTARKLRELIYNAFFMEDHTLHFFFLGGPDFVVGPQAPAAERNILGVIGKVGLEIGGKVIKIREDVREIMAYLCGKVIHPVCGLPGGVSKGLDEEHRVKFLETAKDRRRVRRVRPPDLRRRRPQEQDLRRPRRRRGLQDQDLLHGPGRRQQQGRVL